MCVCVLFYVNTHAFIIHMHVWLARAYVSLCVCMYALVISTHACMHTCMHPLCIHGNVFLRNASQHTAAEAQRTCFAVWFQALSRAGICRGQGGKRSQCLHACVLAWVYACKCLARVCEHAHPIWASRSLAYVHHVYGFWMFDMRMHARTYRY
jgi:hypothetical protein